jgi:catechol 2,3-dioxygenase-like lactoylglutathione lyase family enzyme
MDKELPLMSHMSIGTNQLETALAFYDKVLGSIGAKRIMDEPGIGAAYGRQFPEFWVQIPHNQQKAEPANGVHFAFMVSTPSDVQRFYDAAISAGAKDSGEPGPRKEYSDAYFGCFVTDLDGHKIEAMSWNEST